MLTYQDDSGPGIQRRRHGKGFSYRHPNGKLVAAAVRDRIEALAIPPAWTDVWISPDPCGHLQATGRDNRGRKQYRYHPDWEAAQSQTKFDRMADFGSVLAQLRQRVDDDLAARRLTRRSVVALVVRLLDDTLIRVGNTCYAEDNDSYGLTTLRDDDVDLEGPSTLHFDFIGKGGQPWDIRLKDRRIARMVSQCHELGGQRLFTYRHRDDIVEVTSTDINAYLRDRTGQDITAKDFRTWGGSAVVTGALAITPRPGTSNNTKDVDDIVNSAVDVAAAVLGNTRAVCRNSYVHPAVIDAYQNGDLHDAWAHSRAGRLTRAEQTLLKVIA